MACKRSLGNQCSPEGRKYLELREAFVSTDFPTNRCYEILNPEILGSVQDAYLNIRVSASIHVLDRSDLMDEPDIARDRFPWSEYSELNSTRI